MNPSTDHSRRRRPSVTLPPLCIGGCGFFGTAENEWFCSKCYKDSLMFKIAADADKLVENVISEPRDDVDDDSLELKSSGPRVVVNKNRCGLCNKKVRLLGFQCRCGFVFCGTHRYPEAHSCGFDYKKAGKILIHKENPLCKADKIIHRI